jgi:hypothetical protein
MGTVPQRVLRSRLRRKPAARADSVNTTVFWVSSAGVVLAPFDYVGLLVNILAALILLARSNGTPRFYT